MTIAKTKSKGIKSEMLLNGQGLNEFHSEQMVIKAKTKRKSRNIKQNKEIDTTMRHNDTAD